MTAVPRGTSQKDVSWYRFKYFQILEKLTWNHFRAVWDIQKIRRVHTTRSVSLRVPLCNTHTHTGSMRPASRQSARANGRTVSSALSPEKVKVPKLQFSPKICKVGGPRHMY